MVLPDEFTSRLPSLEEKTFNFWEDDEDITDEVAKRGPRRMSDFIDRIGEDKRWSITCILIYLMALTDIVHQVQLIREFHLPRDLPSSGVTGDPIRHPLISRWNDSYNKCNWSIVCWAN